MNHATKLNEEIIKQKIKMDLTEEDRLNKWFNKVKKLLLSNISKPMKEQKLLLDKEFEAWKGELEQIDDVCIIGIKIIVSAKMRDVI